MVMIEKDTREVWLVIFKNTREAQPSWYGTWFGKEEDDGTFSADFTSGC